MKITLRVLLGLLFFVAAREIHAQQSFDKAAYYEVMATDKISVIDGELGILGKLPAAATRDAYEGALLMKKAGLMKKAKDKVDLFKAGRKKLEASIKTDPENAEWRFLRLMIQENAPKAVNYRKDLEADSIVIVNNASNLSPVVQKAINSYSKNSKVLNSKDF